jgi:tetratricopeptide (TPR) repeat protein
MKLSQATRPLLLLGLIASAALASGCGFVNNLRAKNQLNEGARAYKNRQYAEAQGHFQRALELNPTQKNARFFIARSIHAQYKPGVDQEQNVQRAREAIQAYQQVLAEDPGNEEAYNAIVYLYSAIKDEQKVRETLIQRATLDSTPADKRSQAYTVLASKQWQCSYNITEQKDNMVTVMQGEKAIIQYKKPKEQKDYDEAVKCSTEGLQLAERAISLDPNSEQAWSYKTNLLLEMVKLAKMDNNTDRAAEYQKQADAAQQRTTQLNEENKRKRDAEEKAKASKEATG